MRFGKSLKEKLEAKKRAPYEIHLGDNIEVLRKLNPNQFDSLVTDPPAGIAFMGKDWDTDKGGRDAWIEWMTETMRECYRVMKPGAYGLVWALPRTSHWTAMALENAGFDVRDCVMHIFGSGFPKSHDISKAIDKELGAEREVIGKEKRPDIRGGNYVREGGTKTFEMQILGGAVSDHAKKWDGWGTALKPAYEPWWLIQKPIDESSIAKNVLAHGVGGLNIDASKIGTETRTYSLNGGIKGGNFGNGANQPADEREQATVTGRFPANVIFDEDAAKVLDEQSGHLKGDNLNRKIRKKYATTDFGFGNGAEEGIETKGFSDSGGASRFFYVSKASKSDKGDENGHPTVKSTKLMRYLIKLVTPPGGRVLDPFLGSGTTGIAALRENMGFYGIEKEKEYYDIVLKRYEKLFKFKEDKK